MRSAFLLDGDGGATLLSWDELARWQPERGQLWIHVNSGDPDAMRWLQRESRLPVAILEELLRDDLHPRLEEVDGGGVIATLRGTGLDLAQPSGKRSQLHIYTDPARMISVCEGEMPAIQRARQLYALRGGPADLPALMAATASWHAAALREAVAALEAPVADIEYAAEASRADVSAQLRALRARVTALRRILAPFKVLASRTLALRDSWLVRERYKDWQRLSDDLRDTDALLQSLHERSSAVHDYVSERLARDMNVILYRLTIFSTILLPITAVTGLLGMNVGVAGASYPWMGGGLAFVLVVVVLGVLAWAEYRYMRRRRFLLNSDGAPSARRDPSEGKPRAARASPRLSPSLRAGASRSE